MDSNNTELQGSDQVLDNCCISCQENGKNIEAICFCQQCNKCYCDECDKLHGQLYKKHEVLGRESLDKWPTGQVTIERLEQCKEHDGRKIELFCEDHNQLCCYECQFSSHRYFLILFMINRSRHSKINTTFICNRTKEHLLSFKTCYVVVKLT